MIIHCKKLYSKFNSLNINNKKVLITEKDMYIMDLINYEVKLEEKYHTQLIETLKAIEEHQNQLCSTVHLVNVITNLIDTILAIESCKITVIDYTNIFEIICNLKIPELSGIICIFMDIINFNFTISSNIWQNCIKIFHKYIMSIPSEKIQYIKEQDIQQIIQSGRIKQFSLDIYNDLLLLLHKIQIINNNDNNIKNRIEVLSTADPEITDKDRELYQTEQNKLKEKLLHKIPIKK